MNLILFYLTMLVHKLDQDLSSNPKENSKSFSSQQEKKPLRMKIYSTKKIIYLKITFFKDEEDFQYLNSRRNDMLLELPNGARQKRMNLAEFEDESSNLSRSNSKATGIYSSIDYPTTTNEDIDVLLLPNFHFLLHDFFLISCFQFPSCPFEFALKNQSFHYTN